MPDRSGTKNDGIRSHVNRGPKERILTHAGQLFAEKGRDAVTIREIAEVSSVQLSDIYRHFPDKQSVYVEVRKRIFNEMTARHEAILLTDASPEKKLLKFAASLYQDFLEDTRIVRILARECIDPDTDIQTVIDELFLSHFELAANCIRALGGTEARKALYQLYVFAFANVQMLPLGRAMSDIDYPWRDPVKMARWMLRFFVPGTDWSKVRVRISRTEG